MKRILLILASLLAAFALGQEFGRWERRDIHLEIRARPSVHSMHYEIGDAGAAGDPGKEGECGTSISFCWKTA